VVYLRPEDPDQTHGADREEQRSREEPEEGHDLGAVVSGVPGDLRGHRELGPAVRGLPREVGHREKDRDAERSPRPGRADDIPAPGDDESDGEPRAQEQEGVLVLEAHPRDDANDEP
jgi:hypothetical protein